MAENENGAPPSLGSGENVERKKKTSTKVVRRVKSKKSEKGEVPELKPPTDESNLAPSPAPSVTPETQNATSEVKQQSQTITPSPSSRSAVSSSLSTSIEQPGSVSRRPSSKKRATRSGSNVFAMFSQNQIQQFKEAFGFIDQDKDGIISRSDIRSTFDALGRVCLDKELDEMTKEAPGPINFTMFLTVFGDRIQGADDEDVVLNAFSMYDEGDGFCDEDKLRHALMTWGEKFSKEECNLLLQEAPVDSRGRIDIKRFATLVTRGAEEEDEN